MIVALLAVGVGVSLAPLAWAHNVLISSDPADGAHVGKALASLVFTFDQPVQNFDPVVSLLGPDGKQYATASPTINGNVVTGDVGTGPAGAYTAAYRVVSADGHPVTGEIQFTMTVRGGATGTAAGSGADAAAPTAGGGLSAWLWIGLAVAAAIVAAAAIVLFRRPRAALPGRGKDY